MADRAYRKTMLCLSLLASLAGACSGDDDPSGENGASGAAATSAGRSGSSAAGTAAPPNAIGDLINMFTMPMCDANIKNVESCGDKTCPAPTGGIPQLCTVSCCTTDNKCGTRSTSALAAQFTGTACTLPPQSDPRCPNANLGGMSLPGCCSAQGQCGQSLGNMCISVPAPGAAVVSCGASAPDDAGIEDSGAPEADAGL